MKAIILGLAGLLAACQPSRPEAPASNGGSAAQGRRLLAQYQCGACHTIPGVEGAAGRSAPSLAGFGLRSYIAGRFPNNAAWLARWLQAPRQLAPATLMPDMGVSADEARHMVAYLYSLE